MKKLCFTAGVVLLAYLTLAAEGLAVGPIIVKKPTVREQYHVPGEIVVKFKTEVNDKAIAAINAAHGASVIYTSPFADFRRLRVPKTKTASEMVQIYGRNPNVEYAELNYIAYALWTPNDDYYSYQWHLDNPVYGGVNMEQAWELADGHGAIVAVIDTGVAHHPVQAQDDLANTSFVPGWDFVNNDDDPTDDEGHGTHVTGTIAQSTNNAIGVAGVAFCCSIMPVKVLDSSGAGYYTDIADGIYYATDNGADVINMSLGGRLRSATLENAVAYAYNNQVTVVCASGNDRSKRRVSYPAAYDAYCIAVGATTYDEQVAYYSNQGPSLDLTAPGGDVTEDLNGDGYGDGVLQQTFGDSGWAYYFYQGTSMAAPHVSGVAALLISNGVALTPDEVREALQTTAKDKGEPGWDSKYGYGIVDAYTALLWNPGIPPPPVANFSGTPRSGDAPLTVQFTDDSTGDITNWSWDFSGGATSTEQNPAHTYTKAGTYTVSLMITGPGGSDTETKTNYITVTEPSTGVSMYVASIEMSLSTKRAGRNIFTKAVATVTIKDTSGNPVEGATVYGSWSGATSDTDSGVTNATGEVTLESDGVKNAAGGTTFSFTVDDVVKSGDCTYYPGSNVETSDSISVP